MVGDRSFSQIGSYVWNRSNFGIEFFNILEMRQSGLFILLEKVQNVHQMQIGPRESTGGQKARSGLGNLLIEQLQVFRQTFSNELLLHFFFSILVRLVVYFDNGFLKISRLITIPRLFSIKVFFLTHIVPIKTFYIGFFFSYISISAASISFLPARPNFLAK
jgi:hypothetical protein